MMFPTADVAQPLAFAGRITAKWRRIALDAVDAYIEHKAACSCAKLHTKGDVLTVRVRVMPDPHAQQHSDGMDAGVLHKSGFMRQED